MSALSLPPLSLYVHIPWCVQKCPYCDFNSHGQKGELPEQAYVQALLSDLEQECQRLPAEHRRPLHSIFIGGGTPSLFSPAAITQLLDGVAHQLPMERDIEITMEANPGTAEAQRFKDYYSAGVNRLSIGVQSFQAPLLKALGRIHNPQEAKQAFAYAEQAGFSRINLDLMHGLPGQSLEQAMSDLEQAFDLGPSHLSWYQLTIEANTAFASRPPKLPDEDLLWDIYQQGQTKLAEAGYQQYEVSAYCREQDRARHNLNYWRFGDYIGIGCGAHGKLTLPGGIERSERIKHPKGYLEDLRGYVNRRWQVEADDLPFEYMLNRLRLFEAIPKAEFGARTGLALTSIEAALTRAKTQGLLTETDTHWKVTQQGRLFLNSLLDLFVDE